MSDELNQETEPINAVEEDVQDQETTEELDPVALKAERDAAIAERDLQHKRATKAEAKLKEKPIINESSTDSKLNERLERQDLRLEGYSKDEVDYLMQNGGQNALDNKIVMAGIEAIRKETKSKNATPSGTGKSVVYQKFGERDLKNMPLADLEKIIPQE